MSPRYRALTLWALLQSKFFSVRGVRPQMDGGGPDEYVDLTLDGQKDGGRLGVETKKQYTVVGREKAEGFERLAGKMDMRLLLDVSHKMLVTDVDLSNDKNVADALSEIFAAEIFRVAGDKLREVGFLQGPAGLPNKEVNMNLGPTLIWPQRRGERAAGHVQYASVFFGDFVGNKSSIPLHSPGQAISFSDLFQGIKKYCGDSERTKCCQSLHKDASSCFGLPMPRMDAKKRFKFFTSERARTALKACIGEEVVLQAPVRDIPLVELLSFLVRDYDGHFSNTFAVRVDQNHICARRIDLGWAFARFKDTKENDFDGNKAGFSEHEWDLHTIHWGWVSETQMPVSHFPDFYEKVDEVVDLLLKELNATQPAEELAETPLFAALDQAVEAVFAAGNSSFAKLVAKRFDEGRRLGDKKEVLKQWNEGRLRYKDVKDGDGIIKAVHDQLLGRVAKFKRIASDQGAEEHVEAGAEWAKEG